MYYLRTRPAANAIKFTVDVEALIKESCEGFEMRHFNAQKEVDGDVPSKDDAGLVTDLTAVGLESIDINIPQVQAKTDAEEKLLEKRAPLKACPLRKKKKTADGTYEDDDECLACGS